MMAMVLLGMVMVSVRMMSLDFIILMSMVEVMIAENAVVCC